MSTDYELHSSSDLERGQSAGEKNDSAKKSPLITSNRKQDIDDELLHREVKKVPSSDHLKYGTIWFYFVCISASPALLLSVVSILSFLLDDQHSWNGVLVEVLSPLGVDAILLLCLVLVCRALESDDPKVKWQVIGWGIPCLVAGGYAMSQFNY